MADDREDRAKHLVTDGHYEYAHFCEFCEQSDFWPTVFLAGPYWTHEHCLIKAVEEGRRN